MSDFNEWISKENKLVKNIFFLRDYWTRVLFREDRENFSKADHHDEEKYTRELSSVISASYSQKIPKWGMKMAALTFVKVI